MKKSYYTTFIFLLLLFISTSSYAAMLLQLKGIVTNFNEKEVTLDVGPGYMLVPRKLVKKKRIKQGDTVTIDMTSLDNIKIIKPKELQK